MYTLLFPFNIPSTMKISFDELSRKEGSLKFSLIGKDDDCKLKIEGFTEKSDAEEYINRTNAGLKWVTLNKGLPFESLLEPQEIVYADDGKEAAKTLNDNMGTNYSCVDGLIDGNKPAIYKSDKQMKETTLMPPTVINNFSGEEVFTYLFEGLSFQHSDKIIQYKKLCVAIDLYGAYFTESSDNARFLTLMMAFEALAEGNERPEFVQILIKQWEKQLKDCENKYVEDTEKLHEIESIKGTLAYMKEDSLNKQMYNLVLYTLEENGDSDAKDKANSMKPIYDYRSKLVHKGFIDSNILKQVIRDTKSLIERILKIKFLQIARSEN